MGIYRIEGYLENAGRAITAAEKRAWAAMVEEVEGLRARVEELEGRIQPPNVPAAPVMAVDMGAGPAPAPDDTAAHVGVMGAPELGIVPPVHHDDPAGRL